MTPGFLPRNQTPKQPLSWKTQKEFQFIDPPTYPEPEVPEEPEAKAPEAEPPAGMSRVAWKIAQKQKEVEAEQAKLSNCKVQFGKCDGDAIALGPGKGGDK